MASSSLELDLEAFDESDAEIFALISSMVESVMSEAQTEAAIVKTEQLFEVTTIVTESELPDCDAEQIESAPAKEEPMELAPILANEEPTIPKIVVDKMLEKERQLQTGRQVLAVFDAMGPAKAQKKCDRPFTGRQQEIYQDCFTVTAGNHKNQLTQSSLYEKFDLELAGMEAVLILKGLTKAMKSFDGAPFPDELSIMKTWHIELEAFDTMRDGVVECKGGNSVFKKVFDLDCLCFMVDYLSEEVTETLAFDTRRRGKAYKIVIKLNTGEIELKVEPQEKKAGRIFESAGLRRAVEAAMKKRVGARKLIRDYFWTYLDELEKISSQ